MKNIVTRSISGIIYVGLIVGALLAGSIWFTALCVLFCLLAMLEFQKLTSSRSNGAIALAIRLTDIAAAVALCVVSHDVMTALVYGPAMILPIYIIVRTVLALYDRGDDVFASVGRSALSILYIGVPLSMVSVTYDMSEGGHAPWLVLMMFVMIWLNDTGAYCVGSLFGRHRLCERLSPKKSWEGFWGGMAFCIIAGAVCCFINNGWSMASDGFAISLVKWVGLGMLVSLMSTWGDLFESLIKRSLGVKDSGHLIPGHGGILDRIDSLLLVAPATFVYGLLTSLF